MLSAPLVLLPDLLLSERLLPVAVVILVAVGSVEAYRAAYNATHADEAPDERVYPARRLDMLPGRAEDAPGVGVFASWLGGVPGWLSGGWWMSRRGMSVQQFEDMKARELSNGRLAMYVAVTIRIVGVSRRLAQGVVCWRVHGCARDWQGANHVAGAAPCRPCQQHHPANARQVMMMNDDEHDADEDVVSVFQHCALHAACIIDVQ